RRKPQRWPRPTTTTGRSTARRGRDLAALRMSPTRTTGTSLPVARVAHGTRVVRVLRVVSPCRGDGLDRQRFPLRELAASSLRTRPTSVCSSSTCIFRSANGSALLHTQQVFLAVERVVVRAWP